MANVFQATYIFGIDGGVNTGVALWLPKKPDFEYIQTIDFWEAYNMINMYPQDITAIFIEDPSFNAPTFGRGKMKKKTLDRKAQNVGGVKRESKLLGEGLARQKYVVRYIKPIKGGKWDASQLEQYTGWTKPTNQHGRDAARLVFNRGSRIVIP